MSPLKQQAARTKRMQKKITNAYFFFSIIMNTLYLIKNNGYELITIKTQLKNN